MKGLDNLYEVVLNRKDNPTEGSYTCYLFDAGLDKILKKMGEETSETIIAAKNSTSMGNDEVKEEVCDLLFHLTVLLAERGIPLSEIDEILEERRKKIGNLKEKTISDPNS